MIIYYLNCFYR